MDGWGVEATLINMQCACMREKGEGHRGWQREGEGGG